jgi:signal transduction histidine kinase
MRRGIRRVGPPRRATGNGALVARSLRFGANRLLVALHRVSATLEQATEPDVAAWAALVGLTAGEGLGFNRAFLLIADGDQLVGWLGVGPRNRAEAAVLWAELRRRRADPFARLAAVDPAVIEAERALHAGILQRLTFSSADACRTPHRAFIGRSNHPNPCVRHWVAVLDSDSLAVFPLLEPGRLGGVVLADNFVTRATISPARLEAGATIVHTLHGALERSRLLRRLQEEHRRRLAAEHATALLEAARALAHDVKNPLAVAGGVARELLAAPEIYRDVLPRQLGVIASAIGRAEHRLATLAEELASRSEIIAPAPLDVSPVVERVVEAFRPLAETGRVLVDIRLPGGTAVAIADPTLLERCVENLLGNCLQTLCETGTPEPAVRVVVSRSETHVAVEVANNGPPLPPELRDNPFAGGITTHRAGSGLGLVSVRRLAESMGGHVRCEDDPSGWVRFTVKLRRPP